MLESIKKNIPFEFKRNTSTISLILSAFVIYILIGFLNEFGAWLFKMLGPTYKLIAPKILNIFNFVISIKFQISLPVIILSLILFFPIYRFFDRFFLKARKKERIFEDDFLNNNNGWLLNYWGSTNPGKTNRIENSMMIFEANKNELFNQDGEFGAYFDLKNGIYEGLTYEVSCLVKSDPNTTMQFQLWLHDNVLGNNSSLRSKKYPVKFETPGTKFKEIKVKFVATATNGIRIHLHNKGGLGKIYVDKVSVMKI